jgi:hypothetical protein
MSVHTQDSKERDRAKEIFKNGGAEDIPTPAKKEYPKRIAQPSGL